MVGLFERFDTDVLADLVTGPDGQAFDFRIPHNIDTGVQVFAWIWYICEQELNLTCAVVKINHCLSHAAPHDNFSSPERAQRRQQQAAKSIS